MKQGVDLWRALYADRIPPEQTARECNFIQHFMPLETSPRILDLACEVGRHSLELARRGYITTGVDINAKALQVASDRAAELGLRATFMPGDLRELDHLEGTYDGIILFWQSFGFFDDPVQVGMFSELARLLREHGRLILDVYNALYYISGAAHAHQDENPVAPEPAWRENERLSSISYLEEDRWLIEHHYTNLFDPHLFSPGEIAGIAANHGFKLIAACSDYSPNVTATSERQKMQLVFERLEISDFGLRIAD